MKRRDGRGPRAVKRTRPSSSGTLPPQHPFDLQYGTETSGLIPAAALRTGTAADRHVTAYYGVAPSILRSLLERWRESLPSAQDITQWIFLDVGAGKGRAMLVAAEFPFREVVGVELNPSLVATARSNIASATASRTASDDREAQRLAPLRVLEGNALTISLSPVPTLAFLFHPFERPALHAFLRNLERTFGTHPRSLDLLYVNAEHLAFFRNHPAFSIVWEGSTPMSTEDHIADLQQIATQKQYGSTGEEYCAVLRYIGRELSKEV